MRARISDGSDLNQNLVRIRAVRTKNKFGRAGQVWYGLVWCLVWSGPLSVGVVLVLDTHVQAPSAYTQANGSEMARAFTRRISMGTISSYVMQTDSHQATHDVYGEGSCRHDRPDPT